MMHSDMESSLLLLICKLKHLMTVIQTRHAERLNVAELLGCAMQLQEHNVLHCCCWIWTAAHAYGVLGTSQYQL